MKTLKSFFLLFMGLVINLSACKTYNSANSKIAFISSDANNKHQIYIANPDGSEISQLTKLGENRWPVWSPDGSKIAFQSSQSDWGIFAMNIDGSSQIKLTNSMDDGAGPKWSPDGSRIVFISRYDDSFALNIINVDGTERKLIVGSLGKCNGFSWSPDGQKIAFSCYDAQNGYEIHAINIDGSNEIRLTNSSKDCADPVWSPNGQRIIYSSHPDDYFASLIYIMNADGSDQKRLTDDTNAQLELNYSWSPDGDRVSYNSDFDIFIIDADGNNRTNLTASLDELCSLPTWSPDGRRVSFLCSPRQPDSRSDIWIADVRDGNLEKITSSVEGVGLPVWSPWLR